MRLPFTGSSLILSILHCIYCHQKHFEKDMDLKILNIKGGFKHSIPYNHIFVSLIHDISRTKNLLQVRNRRTTTK